MCVVTLTDEDMEKADVSVDFSDAGIAVKVSLDGDLIIETNYLYHQKWMGGNYVIDFYINYGHGQIEKSSVVIQTYSKGYYGFTGYAKGIEHTHPVIVGKLLEKVMNVDEVKLYSTKKNKWGQYESAEFSHEYNETREYADIDG